MSQFKWPALASVPPPNEIAQMQSPVEKSDEYPAGLQAINIDQWSYTLKQFERLELLKSLVKGSEYFACLRILLQANKWYKQYSTIFSKYDK